MTIKAYSRMIEADTRLALTERAKDYQDLAAMAHKRMTRALFLDHNELAEDEQALAAVHSRQAQSLLTQLLELPQ
jgi:hypothetical protein